MKKILLTLAAACAVTAASASVANLNQVWTSSVENAYKADAQVWNAKVALDADGNVIAAGSFTEDITLAGASLEAIGTSSYIVKYDKTGAASWAVALTGSASVTAIDTDADGNIYVAGLLADVVSFGTTAGEPVEKEGLMIDGAATQKQNASFIAKYSAAGELVKVETFVPQVLADLEATGMYYPEDGDVYFRINHLSVQGSKIYVSANYTHLTTFDGVKFEGTYNDPWGGFYFVPLNTCSIFTINKNLSDCMSVVRCGTEGNLATDDGYKAENVNFTVDGGKVYAVFTGNGALELKAGPWAKKTVDATFADYNYILAVIDNSTIPQLATLPCPAAGFGATYNPALVKVNGTDLYVVGNESFTIEGEGESYSNELFVISAPANALASAEKKVFEQLAGDVTYYDVTSAAFVGNEVVINALGYYNKTVGDNKNGDFASASKTVVFSNDAFAAAEIVANAYGVAAKEANVAFGAIGETGATFALYNDPDAAGIDDITVDNNNAPAEYFNLQGVKVANPENGLYIIRQGNTVTKQVIR